MRDRRQMISESLSFHVCGFGEGRLGFVGEERITHELASRIGGNVSRGGWIEVELGPESIAALVARVTAARARRDWSVREGYLTQNLTPGGADCEWFMLEPVLDRGGWAVTTYPDIAAADIPERTHVAGHYTPFVSEQFRDVVLSQGLRGIEFLWLKDIGRFRAPQWYLPIATKPLGRGIDRPWFDPATLRGDGSWQSTNPRWRAGVWNFDNEQLRPGAGYGDPSKNELLKLFGPGELHVSSFRRMLRPYLPDTDFAYLWRGEDCAPQYSLGRTRLLCFTRRARDVLVENGLLRSEDHTGIEVLDELPAGAANLDELGEGPPPFYETAKLAEFRRIEARERAAFDASPRRPRSNDLEAGLAWLREFLRKHEYARGYDGPATRGEIDAVTATLPLPLPDAWARVLEIANGGWVGAANAIPVHKLAEFHRRQQEIYEDWGVEVPKDLLHVADTACGDWFALKITRAGTDQIPVLFFNHETSEIEREWRTIAEFLDEMVGPVETADD